MDESMPGSEDVPQIVANRKVPGDAHTAQFHRSQVLGLFSDLPHEDVPTMTQI